MPQTKHEIPDVQHLLPGQLPQLAARSPDAHKGPFGHVLLIGGDRGFGGAALPRTARAVRSGARLVSLTTPAGRVGVAAALPDLRGPVPSSPAQE